MFLFFGWGGLIWQPLALQYGKRPVYLLSILATLATQVWAPYTKTNGQWIASKIVQGFVGAPIESLCEISVTDIYFTHERGRYIALYGLLLAGSNFFAPIIAGFIADGQGWQWVLVRLPRLSVRLVIDRVDSTGAQFSTELALFFSSSSWKKQTSFATTKAYQPAHHTKRLPSCHPQTNRLWSVQSVARHHLQYPTDSQRAILTSSSSFKHLIFKNLIS